MSRPIHNGISVGRVLSGLPTMLKPIPLLLVCATLAAQDALSLADAVRAALSRHPSIEAADAQSQAAGARIQQARSGYKPRLSWQESFMAGNNPVYVFGSLLTQRQFTAANFELGSLNRPDPLNNFQSQFTAEQLVYDFGLQKSGVRAAEIGRQITQEEKRRTELGLIASVARSYHAISLAREGLKVAEEAIKTAEADLKRAEALNAAGLATEADVLAVRVHLSAMREQQIRRQADLRVARAALNESLGVSLDTDHQLLTPLTPANAPASPDLEARAPDARPEVLQSRLAQKIAEAQQAAARSQMLPQIAMRGVFELDRQQFVNKGGGNWMFAASMRWNLFDGGRSKESQAEARSMGEAARAGERQLTSAVRLEVRQAQAEFDSAAERIAVTDASIAQAEETLRIVRNRYSAGLANVTELLRAQTALLESRTRRLSAIFDQRMAAIRIQQAAGILNGDSDVLK